MFFWNSLAFSMTQWMLGIWSLFPLPVLKPAWTSGSSWFTYYWSLPWRILSISLVACEMSVILWFWLNILCSWVEQRLFQFSGHCWVFQICWHIECSTSTASLFRIWNSSAGIPSPPLALFIVMLHKAHLTSQGLYSLFKVSHAYLPVQYNNVKVVCVFKLTYRVPNSVSVTILISLYILS